MPEYPFIWLPDCVVGRARDAGLWGALPSAYKSAMSARRNCTRCVLVNGGVCRIDGGPPNPPHRVRLEGEPDYAVFALEPITSVWMPQCYVNARLAAYKAGDRGISEAGAFHTETVYASLEAAFEYCELCEEHVGDACVGAPDHRACELPLHTFMGLRPGDAVIAVLPCRYHEMQPTIGARTAERGFLSIEAAREVCRVCLKRMTGTDPKKLQQAAVTWMPKYDRCPCPDDALAPIVFDVVSGTL